MGKDTIVITGAAGFIGFHLSLYLLKSGKKVVGIDNMNDYYDVRLKEIRLKILNEFEDFCFIRCDISNSYEVNNVFQAFNPEIVVNLAAQAGVRYSIENPKPFIDSNIIGFFNILEACRINPVKHLVFASSSSVYGNQQKTPFSINDRVDNPVSLYAATKKSNELMAYTYSYLYGIRATGLRFFTVYGPYGRPDMAYFKFAEKIMSGEPIQIFNNGNMQRDFTYIDDIVNAIVLLLNNIPEQDEGGVCFRLYNIGNNKPENLMYFIEVLEKNLGKEAVKEYLPMQKGDVFKTYADVSELQNDFGFKPITKIEEGLYRFARWYLDYWKFIGGHI